MRIFKKKLDNGMTTIVVPMKTSSLVSLGFLIKTGSRNEDPEKAGVAHFLEHVTFKGTKKRPSTHVIKELDSIGAYYNASTSYEYTFFYVMGHTNDFKQIFDILLDIYLNPQLSRKEIEKERAIILEEYYSYRDIPRNILSSFIFETLFRGTTLERDIIGSPQTIADITRKDLIEFRKAYYQPINTIFLVTGNFPNDRIQVQNYLSKKLNHITNYPKTIPAFNFIHDDENVFKQLLEQQRPRFFAKKRNMEHVKLSLIFPMDIAYDDYKIEMELISDILTGGMFSRLKLLLREKNNLVYSVGSSIGEYCGINYFMIMTATYPDNVKNIILKISKELNNIKKNGFRAEELKRVKRAKIVQSLSPNSRSPLSIMHELALTALYDEEHLYTNDKDIIEKIKNVKLNDLTKISNDMFQLKRLNIFALGKISKHLKF
jgi:predicted Zn-dependent peptidase